MMTSSVTDGVKTIPFERLSDRVSFHRSENGNDHHRPPLLILCTWMDASPRLVNKYAQDYLSRFPSFTILLIRTDWKAMFTNSSEAQKDFQPAVDFLLDHLHLEKLQGSSETETPFIYGAIYSNGGVSALTTLAKHYRGKTGQPLSIKGLVLDSCPAPYYYSGAVNALSNLIPRQLQIFPIKQMINAFLWLFLLCWSLVLVCTGGTSPILIISRDLNDTNLLVPSSKGGQRAYIYSKSDLIVHHDGPEESARVAELKGWKVKELVFEVSKHVAHAMAYKDEYWKVVQETLN